MVEKILRSTQPLMQSMQDHVGENYPEEACGLLAGEYGVVRRVFPITNVLHSRTQFRMDGREQVDAMLEIERRGMALIALFHSHPDGPAGLSNTDIEEMRYPEVMHLVWSRANGVWICHAFRLVGSMVQEEEMKIEVE